MVSSEKRRPLEQGVIQKPDGRYLILCSKPEEPPKEKPKRKRS